MEGAALWANNFLHEIRSVGGDAAFHPQTQMIEVTRKGIPTYQISEQINAWRALQKAMYT